MWNITDYAAASLAKHFPWASYAISRVQTAVHSLQDLHRAAVAVYAFQRSSVAALRQLGLKGDGAFFRDLRGCETSRIMQLWVSASLEKKIPGLHKGLPRASGLWNMTNNAAASLAKFIPRLHTLYLAYAGHRCWLASLREGCRELE